MVELLAPAGNFEKMKIAFTFGADAVYFAGKQFGLRAFAGNFSNEEIVDAAKYAHALNKKVYITLNIVAREGDFENLKEYLNLLEAAKVDGVIISDIGIVDFVKQNNPNLVVHVSTQANLTNSHSINFMEKMGAERVVLARELSLAEIKNIKQNINPKMEIEAFVHGAMCISYSGRCLLSNYINKRDANKGACSQPCRYCYTVKEYKKDGEEFEVKEDDRGTYIFNSRDLCMIEHIDEMIESGVCSLKIEGRMKSEYYVANVVNAYRRAIDKTNNIEELKNELKKSSHRNYTTAFYLGQDENVEIDSSKSFQQSDFVAIVLEDAKNGFVKIEQRNRFKVGEELQVLSPTPLFNTNFKVETMQNLKGEIIDDAKNVQETLILKTNLPFKKGDILRKIF